uniref:ST3 beta-galactoside alpha-2,3-sialyltransferase 1 n=1 Tax=Sinocyclocheilus rhinocerous TaxID=307959 RepID=A0A673FQQ0_9TELE
MWLLMHYRGSYMTAVICVIIFCTLLAFKTPVDEVSEGMCACKDCVRQQTHSFWFNELYDLSIQPLLTRENYILSEDIYKYWKGLQKNKNEDNYTAVVEKLFSLFPDKMQYSDASPKRCRTCAVVGNSGNLKGSHMIAFDQVCCQDVAVCHHSLPCKVLSPFKILNMEWLISAFTTKKITRYVPSRSLRSSLYIYFNYLCNSRMILHPAFIKYVHEIWLLKCHGRYPSTGFLTLMCALHICDEVNIFGFGATSDGNWHHYFDKTLISYEIGVHMASLHQICVTLLTAYWSSLGLRSLNQNKTCSVAG